MDRVISPLTDFILPVVDVLYNSGKSVTFIGIFVYPKAHAAATPVVQILHHRGPLISYTEKKLQKKFSVNPESIYLINTILIRPRFTQKLFLCNFKLSKITVFFF